MINQGAFVYLPATWPLAHIQGFSHPEEREELPTEKH